MHTHKAITLDILSKRKPRKALNKTFLKFRSNRSQVEQFKENLVQLLDRTYVNEIEEFHRLSCIFIGRNRKRLFMTLWID